MADKEENTTFTPLFNKMKKNVGLVLEYIDKKGKAGIEKLIEEAEENNDDSD